MSKYRYTIITCNFNNYEIFREVINPIDDVEYIYVTDDKNLTSNTWKIIVDPFYDDIKNSFDKVVEFRKKVLDYCSTDICCRIDASIVISGDAFEKTIKEFCKGNYEISFIMHPWFNNIDMEYYSWNIVRNMPKDEIDNIKSFFNENLYDFTLNTVYTLGVVIQKNNELNHSINEQQYKVLSDIKEYCKLDHFNRCDQAIFTYTLDKYFNNIKVLPLHYTLLERNDYSFICVHNTNRPLFNKCATFLNCYKLFGHELNKVFNGNKWIHLLTNTEIFNKAIKILLKSTENVYTNLDEIKSNKTSYKEWFTNEDVITIGSSDFKDFQYNDQFNKHHYKIEWYYEKLLPILVSELKIPYNDNDFVEIRRNNIYCKIPKEIQKLEIYCPFMEKNKNIGHVVVYYDMTCLYNETSMSTFMSNNIYQPEIFYTHEDEFHKIFKYCHFPVKIINYTCQNNNSILVIGNSHTIPFIPILTKYYHTVVIIDNRLQEFTFQFMFSYIDFKDILILASYDTNEKKLLNITNFK